ncbi:hypothetical protein AX16_004214 [Volvariella volvacea WC 439]|nr:hypothetical protein AX16_004214 [Volvariella volvacea WC 439]
MIPSPSGFFFMLIMGIIVLSATLGVMVYTLTRSRRRKGKHNTTQNVKSPSIPMSCSIPSLDTEESGSVAKFLSASDDVTRTPGHGRVSIFGRIGKKINMRSASVSGSGAVTSSYFSRGSGGRAKDHVNLDEFGDDGSRCNNYDDRNSEVSCHGVDEKDPESSSAPAHHMPTTVDYSGGEYLCRTYHADQNEQHSSYSRVLRQSTVNYRGADASIAEPDTPFALSIFSSLNIRGLGLVMGRGDYSDRDRGEPERSSPYSHNPLSTDRPPSFASHTITLSPSQPMLCQIGGGSSGLRGSNSRTFVRVMVTPPSPGA